MKCPNCQQVFTVPAASTPAATVPPTPAVSGPFDKLFPDVIPDGPDPLANHIVEDPGFAEVDLDEVRRRRLLDARKKDRIAEAFTSSSSLAKMEDEEYQKERTRIRNVGYLSGDTLLGFDGRINRKKFWLSSVFAGLIGAALLTAFNVIYVLVLSLLDMELPRDPAEALDKALGTTMPLLFANFTGMIVMGWISVALHVKRYHDLGKPGSRLWLWLIPVIGGVWVLVECGFQRGQPRRNRYGPDPLAPST
jgi:uncharacterized membrane protein YhaH (DUF805 family)